MGLWVDRVVGPIGERLSRFQRSQRMSGLACLLLRLQTLGGLIRQAIPNKKSFGILDRYIF